MAEVTLQEMLTQARGADGPRLVDKGGVRLGGVDPLGLRQINFDLMDEVLPDLNDVASHVCPYIIISWAWRRARRIIEANPKIWVIDEQMRNFSGRTHLF